MFANSVYKVDCRQTVALTLLLITTEILPASYSGLPLFTGNLENLENGHFGAKSMENGDFDQKINDKKLENGLPDFIFHKCSKFNPQIYFWTQNTTKQIREVSTVKIISPEVHFDY